MGFWGKDDPRTAARKEVRVLLHAPWESVGRLRAIGLDRQLRRECLQGHFLAGGTWTAIARSRNDDDVLYAASDGRIASVHLTWQQPSSPSFPSFGFFESVADFAIWLAQEDEIVARRNGEEVDFFAAPERNISPSQIAQSAVCASCGADWALGQFTAGCQVCGNHALERPCLKCGGQCGATWRRAVSDSNDSGEAHWIGQCLQEG